ncbi:hypothetical protein [Lederbergia citrea]|uniref:hypothetical protein n=1 Tax=Lederbergia citrea TaxID=2833581 RepID=UPI001BC992C4|nr:hypothetical protein [Lederbergia citrea]MBS4177363.1 hypothetical protein [Lederbergia citrea]
MSEYQDFLQERDRIDYLVQEGYKIKNVTENLSGAFVLFEKNIEPNVENEVLHIQTAEGRKYFSVVLINQQKITI